MSEVKPKNIETTDKKTLSKTDLKKKKEEKKSRFIGKKKKENTMV